MPTIRGFEEKVVELVATSRLAGALHPYAGEEASRSASARTSPIATSSRRRTALTATASPRASRRRKRDSLEIFEVHVPRYRFGGKARAPLTMRTPVGAGLRAAAQHSQTRLGKDNALREGADVTLVGVGRTVQTALDAADALARNRTSAEVVDRRSLQRLDDEGLLASPRRPAGSW